MQKVIVKEARNGSGVFSTKKFAPNEMILEVRGVLITGEVDEKIDERTRSNSFRFNENYYMSPAGEIADFINHSCTPNAKVEKERNKLYILAIQNIESNQEITFDYSTVIASDDEWTMECNCGSTKCRRVIGRFVDLPLNLQKRYIATKIVPRYILSL